MLATSGFTKAKALAGTSLAILGALSVPAPAQDNSGPVTLGPVTVNGATENNALTHTSPLATIPSASLQDTPQAVTVVTGEVMKEQATTTLGDALRNVPGITIAIGEGGTLAGDQFKIRGFDAKDDVYLDGLRDFAAYTRDSFDYEEVQVLKGPSGLMFGRGTGGGAINTVSKIPTLGEHYTLGLEGGNGNHLRATADLNYPFSDTGAARLNLMLTDTGVVDRDLTHSTRFGIAPSVALGLGTDTSFTLGFIHQQTAARQDYGVVVASPPDSVYAKPVTEFGVPRATYMGFNADHDKNTADLLTAKLSHNATDWLSLENDARVAVYSRDFRYTPTDRCDNTAATSYCNLVLFGIAAPGAAPGTADPATALAGTGGGGPYHQNSWGAQDIASANADFHLGPFRSQLIAGIDVSYQRADRTIFAYTLPRTAQFTYLLGNGTAARTNIGFPLFGFDHQTPPGYEVILPTAANSTGANAGATSASATSVVTSTGDATDLGFFLTDRVWLNQAVSLIAGLRMDQYRAAYRSVTVAGATADLKAPSFLLDPRASLVFEPDQSQTFYLSWGKAATPLGTSVVGQPTPISAAAAAAALQPDKSETIEAGAKLSLFDNALGLSVSLFQVSKSNALQTDPVNGAVLLQSSQKQRVQGFEASATGTVLETVNLTAAYTYLNPVIVSDASTPANVGRQITFVPKHALSVWGDYDAHELLAGLSFGGGLVYQSHLFNNYTAPNPAAYPLGRIVEIPETVELDAVIAYQIDRLRFQLNINNLADRLYYSQSFGNRGTPAPGRSFIFSVGASF